MSSSFQVSGKNVRVFSKAVSAVSRLGDDIFIEIHDKTFAVKTMNLTKSAFIETKFERSFFTKWTKPNQLETESIRVLSKPISFAFKRHIDRICDNIQLFMTETSLKLVFGCHNDITKEFQFPLLESEVLSGNFDPSKCKGGKLDINVKILSSALDYFDSNTMDLAIRLTRNGIQFSTPFVPQSMHSQLQLNAEEFIFFLFDAKDQSLYDVDFIICVKDLKSMLYHCDPSHEVNIFFERPGLPLLMRVDIDRFTETLFALASQNSSSNSDSTTSIAKSVEEKTTDEAIQSGSGIFLQPHQAVLPKKRKRTDDVTPLKDVANASSLNISFDSTVEHDLHTSTSDRRTSRHSRDMSLAPAPTDSVLSLQNTTITRELHSSNLSVFHGNQTPDASELVASTHLRPMAAHINRLDPMSQHSLHVGDTPLDDVDMLAADVVPIIRSEPVHVSTKTHRDDTLFQALMQNDASDDEMNADDDVLAPDSEDET